MSARPLDGTRIVDFTWIRAGPWATRWLALLGAEVIKVEWPAAGVPNARGGASDGQIMKRSITLNARSPRGLETLKKLISVSDVVIENFSAGVLKSWGLSFEETRAVKPDIIYVSMAGFGHSGPRTNYVTMGTSVQALSGLTQLSGLPDKQPAGWGWSYMDDTGGMYGTMNVLAALQHRHRTGEGQHVDLAQVSAAMTLTGPALLDVTVNGRGSRRAGFPPGNRSVWPGTPTLHNYRGPICVPHNAYRTRPGGYNDWAGIVCESDEEWQRLIVVMGSPRWAREERFATLDGRIEYQEELDRRVEEWTLGLEKYELTELCQASGVRALPVQSSEDRVEHDPQLHFRGHYNEAPHPTLGMIKTQQSPWKMSPTPTPVKRGGPLCGQDNVAILCGLLGLSRDELRAGYEDNTFWPKLVPLEPYLREALTAEAPGTNDQRTGRSLAPALPHSGGEKRAREGPLTGLRVIELADRSGQWCGKLLADLGAEVIKVEPPEGVPERRIGPFYRDVEDPNRSLYFWHYNTSKRSVTLDLQSEEGIGVFRRLVAGADVLLETTRPGTLPGLGLDYDSLAGRNHRLVMCSLTAFGQDGPWRNYLDSDMLQLAAGGQMAGCGYDPEDDPDQRPIAPGGGNAWHMGGHYAIIAILAALQYRNRAGEGQYIDVSVHESCALTTEAAVPLWIFSGAVVKRQTGRHASARPSPPTQMRTRDGKYLQLTNTAMTVAYLKPLFVWMDSLGMADDLMDPKYLDSEQANEHREHVAEVVARFVASMDAEEAMKGGQEMAGVGWGVIRATEELLDDEHFRARGFFVMVEHPELGEKFIYPGAPHISSVSPWRIHRRAPLIGEDNEMVLGSLK